MREITDFSCIECDASATHGVYDMREVTPEGSTVEHWTTEGPARYGCAVHSQQSKVFPLDNN